MFGLVWFCLERQTVWLQRFCQLLTEFIAAEHRSKELPSRSARFGETFCTNFFIYFPSCLVVLNWFLKLCFGGKFTVLHVWDDRGGGTKFEDLIAQNCIFFQSTIADVGGTNVISGVQMKFFTPKLTLHFVTLFPFYLSLISCGFVFSVLGSEI